MLFVTGAISLFKYKYSFNVYCVVFHIWMYIIINELGKCVCSFIEEFIDRLATGENMYIFRKKQLHNKVLKCNIHNQNNQNNNKTS